MLKHSWSDTKHKPLEQQLYNVLIDLTKVAVHIRNEREAKDAASHVKERQKREEELVRQKQEEELKRIEHLGGLIKRWEKAKQIREFVDQAKQNSFQTISPDMEKGEWIGWALSLADKLDPLPTSS